MEVTAEILKELIERELSTLSDDRVTAHIRSMLVEPHVVQRRWDYGEPGQTYPCWIVLDDTEDSRAGIGFCAFGFGPESPWGLVAARDHPNDLGMGMDSAWFRQFLDAFFDSFASIALPIWQVFEEERGGNLVVLTGPGDWDGAWDRVAALRGEHPGRRYHCRHDIKYGSAHGEQMSDDDV